MRKGDTILFEAPPSAVAYAAVGGKKEAEGPLADAFDMLIADTLCGEKTWEKAESDFARYCLEAALKKGRLQADALDAVFAGDLQCQCTASAYTMRGFDTPYLGLYGACSTMAEGFGLAACMVAGGHMQYAAAMSSSHFCAAERQFRTPLDYGGKRTPTAQWTVTGAGGNGGVCLLDDCFQVGLDRFVVQSLFFRLHHTVFLRLNIRHRTTSLIPITVQFIIPLFAPQGKPFFEKSAQTGALSPERKEYHGSIHGYRRRTVSRIPRERPPRRQDLHGHRVGHRPDAGGD